jgi:hypothetical protein
MVMKRSLAELLRMKYRTCLAHAMMLALPTGLALLAYKDQVQTNGVLITEVLLYNGMG